MNNTNRPLNRLGIFLFGLILLVLGGGGAFAAAVPSVFSGWRTGSKDVSARVPGVIRDTLLGSTGQSWITLVVAIAAVVLIVLLLVFVFRQGHGRTGTLLTKPADAGSQVGSVIVSSAIAEKTIAAALEEYSGIASSSVSTFLVKGTATLRIMVSARRGVSPTDVRDYVERVIERFDEVFGEETPVFLKINGGFASRRAKAARLPEQAMA